MQKEPLPLDIDTDLSSYMAECRQRLEDNLTTVAAKAREKTLARCVAGGRGLRIAPLRKNAPAIREAFAEKAYSLMPHVKITELLARSRSVDEISVIDSCICAPWRRPRIGKLYSPPYSPTASISDSRACPRPVARRPGGSCPGRPIGTCATSAMRRPLPA